MKFQGGTSAFSKSQLLFWASIAVVVILAGEAALQSSWPWLGAASVASAAVAVLAWRQPRSRAVAVGLLALFAALAVGTARTGHVVWHAEVLPAEWARTAESNRDRHLSAAVAAAIGTAKTALDRVGNTALSEAAELDLSDLLDDAGIETAIAVLGRDTVLAVAGPHRIQPLPRRAATEVVSTPFVRLLVIRASARGREASVTLLLDAIRGVQVAAPSLAQLAGAGIGITWKWELPDSSVSFPNPELAKSGIMRAMRAQPPGISVLLKREAATTRFIVGVGLAVLGILILLTAQNPAARAGALLLPLGALVRSDVIASQFGGAAIKALLGAAALILLSLALWQRPRRRSPIGVVLSILLLLATAPLLVVVAREVVPAVEPESLIQWFGWQVILALGTAGFLSLASAPLRTPDDAAASPRWGTLAALAVLVIGIGGIEAWQPEGWASWYLPFWVLPFALMLPVTTPRARLVAIASCAGVLAALATWSVSLERRLELASADLDRLAATSDTVAARALDDFIATARAAHATKLDRLYGAWRTSSVASQGLPTYLSLWTADGHQREVATLDSLSISWDDLDTLVSSNGPAPRRVSKAIGVGHHEILILPLAHDTVATVTVGPRSRLLAPTTFGRLTGWRSPRQPAYRVSVVSPSSIPAEGEFHRSHRFVTAERRVGAGDVPRTVRATVEMSRPRPFGVRAALVVVLDIGLILGAWFALERLLGLGVPITTPMFRRSYRRTIATALAAFFIVPALLFTLWSILRLRNDAARQNADQVARTLRDVAVHGGFSIAADRRPSNDSLGSVADSVNAELGVYRDGRLIASSTPMLAELGLLPPVVKPSLRPGVGIETVSIAPAFPASGLRLGAEAVPPPGTLVAAALPGSDTDLAGEQVDLAMLLLLVSLTGGAAAVAVAGFVAQALGHPIDLLRRTAVAIGRREVPPSSPQVPAEFVPVFGAISQMEQDLRSSEAELQAGRARTAAILATVATGVIGIDATGQVIHANPRALEFLGEQLLVGEALAPRLPQTWSSVAAGIQRLLGSAPRRWENHELQVGDRRFAVTLAPLGDGGLVLAITDITEASRAARILAWGEMARQVAHEIKNPLTPMRLGLQHLKRVGLDAPEGYPQLVRETAERLLTEIDRLDRIARSFARYGTPPDRIDRPLEPTDLRSTAEEMAGLFALASERPSIEVVGAADGLVLARREELIQVLLNLLDNSRQAGARTVRLVLGGRELRVEDDGKGIAGEHLGRLFEPTFSTTTSGTGLGLPIVRRLVEGWGATIEVESPPGGGASFILRFVAAP